MNLAKPATTFREIKGKLKFEKGTWFRNVDSEHDLYAAYCCATCGRVSTLSRSVHVPERNGTITPGVICPSAVVKPGVARNCDFSGVIQLVGWMPLYAIAVERLKGEQWVPEISYVHADNSSEAVRLFFESKEHVLDRMVGVSVCVGFKAQDDEGKVLRA